MTTPRMQDKRFRQMLDAAPDAMVVVDQAGSVVALNREAERLFGWIDAELRGEPSSRLIPQRFQQVYEALGVSDGESPGIRSKGAPVRIFAQRRDGSEFPSGNPPQPSRSQRGRLLRLISGRNPV